MLNVKKITDKYNVIISGNIPLTSVMLLGNQKDNQKAAVDLIDKMGFENFILAPGCDMPYDVPKENIIGIAQAVQDYEATKKFLENYTSEKIDIDVKLPDYANLSRPLIEVYTIDSSTCAACGYMKGAADDVQKIYGDKIEVIEYKITEKENIARLGKLNISNLPAMLINGELKYVSIIPNRKELKEEIEKVL